MLLLTALEIFDKISFFTIALLIVVAIWFTTKSFFDIGIVVVLSAMLFVSLEFELTYLTIVSILLTIAALTMYIVLKRNYLRALAGKLAFLSLSHHDAKKRNDLTDSVQEIIKTIKFLSRNQTGAIIAFERNDDLSDYIKEGKPVKAPISCELLGSIFYEGTPLHDGLLVIKDGMIAAANIFVTPTRKALNGRYGARHRAAVGLSEATDALIIVVSEETGRVSIVQYGNIEPVRIEYVDEVIGDIIRNL